MSTHSIRYELLVHGWFSVIGDEATGVTVPVEHGEISGFYASRMVEAPNLESAINRIKENIRQELSSSLLKSASIIINIDVEDHAEIDALAEVSSLRGFTFY